MNLVVDYLTLRRAVGLLGLALPLLLLAIAGPQESLSAYYHSPARLLGVVSARDVFVVVLALVAALLAVYRGYDRGDRVCARVAAAALALVALVPVGGHTGLAHELLAVVFFVASATLCVRFGYGGYRVKTFRALAGVIVLALAAAAAGAPLLLVEAVAVWAFGLAWLLKGKALEAWGLVATQEAAA